VKERERRMKNLSLCALGAALWLAAAAPPAAAGGEPDSATPLAINLDEFEDWNTTWVFVDLFKEARDWIVQVPGTTNPFQVWGESMPTTADGWPLPPPGRAAAALMKREQGGNYPGGIYNVFWKGTGQLEFFYDATVVSYDAANRTAQVLVQPSNSGVLVQIHSVNPNDPVHDVQVIMPGFENTYQQHPFHPLFLESLEPFGTLRFMQWMKTNNSQQQFWWQRPTKDYYSQSTSKGMAIEWMIDLANETGKAPWFNIPHLATDNYIREFARLVRDNLNPGIPVYIEWSNEVWNEIYAQWTFSKDNAFNLGLEPWNGNPYIASWKYTAVRSVEMFDIWRQEFTSAPGGPDRVVRVLPTQDANPAVGLTIMDQPVNGQPAWTRADVLAGAPYFGVNEGQPENQWATLSLSVDQLLDQLENEIRFVRPPIMKANVDNAANRGLDYIAYEGGQHLVGVGSAIDNQALTGLFQQANRHPRMYDLYRLYFDEWAQAGGGSLALFTLAGRYTLHGSWGALEYQTQPVEQAHKFRAMRDYAEQNGGTGGGPTTPVNPSVEILGYPCGNTWASHYGSPTVGNSGFGVTLSGAAPFGQAFLYIANQAADYEGIPLPINFDILDLYGCNLWIGDGLTVTGAASGAGNVSLPVLIPDEPSLAGRDYYFQWLAPKFGVNPGNLAFSQALKVIVGS
jgi:hypothetical protein